LANVHATCPSNRTLRDRRRFTDCRLSHYAQALTSLEWVSRRTGTQSPAPKKRSCNESECRSPAGIRQVRAARCPALPFQSSIALSSCTLDLSRRTALLVRRTLRKLHCDAGHATVRQPCSIQQWPNIHQFAVCLTTLPPAVAAHSTVVANLLALLLTAIKTQSDPPPKAHRVTM
jgi:hypothetical protein